MIDPANFPISCTGDACAGDTVLFSETVFAGTPRFIARLVECDNTGLPLASEGDVDALTGFTCADQDLLFCEIAWIDPAPPQNDLASLLEQAIEAFHDFPEAS